MIRLHRKDGKKPPNWLSTVGSALPDLAAYQYEACRFERLRLNSGQRRDGFAQFAAHVLIRRNGKPAFPRCWSVAKDVLGEMSHWKCSYCEGEINSPTAGHVELFKPKSLFPSLAYEWKNYFMACAGCNVKKGDKWPDKGGYVRPDRGNPARAFRFEMDGSIHSRRVDGNAQRTIDDFDLKRRVLVRRRRFHIRQMLEEVKDVRQVFDLDRILGRRMARNIFKRVTEPGSVYSAALAECFRLSSASVCLQVGPSKRRRSQR